MPTDVLIDRECIIDVEYTTVLICFFLCSKRLFRGAQFRVHSRQVGFTGYLVACEVTLTDMAKYIF